MSRPALHLTVTDRATGAQSTVAGSIAYLLVAEAYETATGRSRPEDAELASWASQQDPSDLHQWIVKSRARAGERGISEDATHRDLKLEALAHAVHLMTEATQHGFSRAYNPHGVYQVKGDPAAVIVDWAEQFERYLTGAPPVGPAARAATRTHAGGDS